MTASDAQGLEELRIKYLSKKGVVNDLMNEFRNVPADQKREIGMKLNELKTALQNKFNELRQNLATQEDDYTDLDSRVLPTPSIWVHAILCLLSRAKSLTFSLD